MKEMTFSQIQKYYVYVTVTHYRIGGGGSDGGAMKGSNNKRGSELL